MKNNIKNYVNKIKILKDKYETKVNILDNELDKALYNDYIIKFCLKYNLSFRSGMGTFIFYSWNNTTICMSEYQKNKSTFWTEFNEISQIITDINVYTKFCGCGYDYKNERFKQHISPA